MFEILEKINGPDDLKKLTIDQLDDVAGEVREFILHSVSKTGGHLASNLGIVELTIALHYVFDLKHDKLLWDVGHQSYAHKILTGRRDKFESLRKSNGISGFPNPEESCYDPFMVGHAGTSIATAIGMALGNAHQRSQDKIISLVGDASIVNGVSLEGLNNLGLVKRQMLIVLNDNSMAIDATEGALAKYFSKMRLSHTYEDLVKTTNNILEHLPVIGKGVEDAIEKIKKSIRMVLPGNQLFEAMNIPYFGPVNGHDIKSLVQLFRTLKEYQRPAILHVYTKKGKGFKPAGDKPQDFHSTGPFKINGDAIESGTESGAKTFTKVFGQHLVKMASQDERIVAISCAMCEGTGLGDFRQKFPDRFYDTGIAESAAVDIAAGLAKTGLKPFVCIYSTFLQRAFDQIFQEVSLQDLGVVFCIDRAGFVGPDGPTHHGSMDTGFCRLLPNLTLIAPADENEMRSALDFALKSKKSVAIRYPKDNVSDLGIEALSEEFEMGKSVQIRKNDGSKAVIVNYGCLLEQVIKAADLLEHDGIEVDIINARFAAPIDEKIVSLFNEDKCIITVEDHYVDCGFGSALLEKAAEQGYMPSKGPIKIMGADKCFAKHDLRKNQLIEAGLNAENIAETVKKSLSKE
ncbi:MAG: 1-deoxy-D-xylulose-5-phosphate synthase [Planctomycetes bacterium]|nr:1-deoxy-D-xylulose-5-phosphate synthase [Planctomycetota bacterium]MBL7106763.1 1-deoxy-D-xylulose-5-phosphate synthase [Phycisphaerae bacterium]